MARKKSRASPAPAPTPLPTALFLVGITDDNTMQMVAGPPDYKLTPRIWGSLNHFEHVKVPGLANEVLILSGEQPQRVKVTQTPKIIVNCIINPDAAPKGLAKAQKIIENIQKDAPTPIPVVNPPTHILRTTRDRIYEAFKNLPGLHIPRVIRITPKSVADTVAQITSAGLKLPCIMRGTGTHGGKDMQLIERWSEQDLLKLEQYPFDGREFYVTEWTDFKNSDGLYRKCRVLIVGGNIIPRHMIITNSWKVHSASRDVLMKTNEVLRSQEAQVLKNFSKFVQPQAIASLQQIHKSLGLDYFGLDCSIQNDGALTVFEINAAFNAMVQDGLKIYPYLAAPMESVKSALNDVVARKAGMDLAPARAASA